MQTGGMLGKEEIEQETVKEKERGERKQVRTALTESNEGQVEKLLCDSSGFAENKSKGQSESKDWTYKSVTCQNHRKWIYVDFKTHPLEGETQRTKGTRSFPVLLYTHTDHVYIHLYLKLGSISAMNMENILRK